MIPFTPFASFESKLAASQLVLAVNIPPETRRWDIQYLLADRLDAVLVLRTAAMRALQPEKPDAS